MTDEELVLAIDAAVRSVAGVTMVYSALPPLARSARQLTSGASALPLVSLVRSGDGLAVTVNVGVGVGGGAGAGIGTLTDGSGQAPATAAAVAIAVRSVLAAAGPGADTAEVVVRVSRVHD